MRGKQPENGGKIKEMREFPHLRSRHTIVPILLDQPWPHHETLVSQATLRKNDPRIASNGSIACARSSGVACELTQCSSVSCLCAAFLLARSACDRKQSVREWSP